MVVFTMVVGYFDIVVSKYFVMHLVMYLQNSHRSKDANPHS